MSGFSPNTGNDGKICFLVSEINPEMKFILLDKVPLVLGRTKETGITDQKLSKNQVKFEADYSRNRVLVEQLGSNHSAVNNESMIRGEKRLLYHGDKVSLLFTSNYVFNLNFVPNAIFNSYGLESNKRLTRCSDQYIVPKKCRSVIAEKWETKDDTLLVYNSSNIVHKNKIAAFDMDGTIIVTQSGNVFPVDYKDWKISSPEVTKALRMLSNDGYKVVIFTNQGGIANKNKFKEKIENIANVIKTPVQVFVATQGDIYRKPAPGMWNTFVSDYNGDLSIDMNSSFFCGDAAGRSDRIGSNGQKVKKDHSCCDRLFAINIGLKFYTPEEYFWKIPTEEFKLPLFNQNDVLSNVKYTDAKSKLLSSGREMIIMVGPPGAGKSYFASNVLGCHDNYIILTCDISGNWTKCINDTHRFLSHSSSCIVIDNTNPDKASRKQFIDIAKSYNIPCRIFLMNVSKEHAKHNYKFRELTDKKRLKFPDVVISAHFSIFEEPSLDEGVEEIVPINFVPHFKDSEQQKLYKMYLL